MGGNSTITVCHIISGDLWAGAEVQAHTLLKSLAETRQFALTAILLNEGRLSEKLRECDVKVMIVEEKGRSFSQIHRAMRYALGNDSFDIIHTHRIKENVLGTMFKREGRCRFMFRTIHGLGEAKRGWSGIKTRVYAIGERYMDRKAFDRIIAVSNDIRKRLMVEDNPKYVTIHNALDPTTVRTTREPAAVRDELGIARDAFVIGTAGRMVTVKNYPLLLDAVAMMKESHSSLKVVIAGDGPTLPSLKKYAARIGVDDKVIFTGFRKDIHDIMSAFDVFVISSHHEGIPNVALEAFLLGIPLVSTAVGGMVEVIEDGVSGTLVPPGDAGSFSAALQRLADDPGLRNRMSQSGRARLQTQFSVERMRDEVARLYTEFMATVKTQ